VPATLQEREPVEVAEPALPQQEEEVQPVTEAVPRQAMPAYAR
jgi:hypothetical protein